MFPPEKSYFTDVGIYNVSTNGVVTVFHNTTTQNDHIWIVTPIPREHLYLHPLVGNICTCDIGMGRNTDETILFGGPSPAYSGDTGELQGGLMESFCSVRYLFLTVKPELFKCLPAVRQLVSIQNFTDKARHRNFHA